MHVALYCPPAWTPTMPHLAIPALTAFLRAQGIDVTQRDLNVEFYNHVLGTPALQAALVAVTERIQALARVQHRAPLESAEYEHLIEVLVGAQDLIDDVPAAMSILRGPKFYVPEENLGAAMTVIDALEFASAPYFPTSLSLFGLQTPQHPDSTKGILEAIGDERRNMFARFYRESVIADLSDYRPDVVGITLSTIHQVVPGLTLAAMVKAFDRDIHIVVGGKMVTCWREQLPKSLGLWSVFDSAVVYAGESPLLQLIERLEGGQSLSSVPNLIWRDGDTLVANQARKDQEMDELLTPDFGGLPLDKYLVPEPILPIEACRGCYWRRCAFCNLGYGQSRAYACRPMEHVVRDMATLMERHAATTFFFVDEALAPATLAALSETLASSELDVSWAACARFEDRMSTDLLCRAASAGCRVLMYGLESGSQRVLDRIDKGSDFKTISRVLRNGASVGIWNHVFVLFGFPEETAEDADKTTQFVLGNLEAIHSMAAGTFVLEKGSRVAESPSEYGISEVIQDPESDLAFRYGYELASGEAPEVAQAHLDRFTVAVEARREPKVFFYDAYLPLYAAHFADPSALVAKGTRSRTESDESIEP